MLGKQIRENGDVVLKAGFPVLLEALGSRLNNAVCASGADHLAHQPLYSKGAGHRHVICIQYFPCTDADIRGRNDAGLYTACREARPDEIGGRGLSFRSRNPDCDNVARGEAVPHRRRQGEEIVIERQESFGEKGSKSFFHTYDCEWYRSE